MRDDDLVDYVIEPLQKAVDFYKDRKKLRAGLDLATPGQEALFALWWTQTEINNGGFHQYFHNPTGLLSPEALKGYELVGAKKFMKLHERAIALFKPRMPTESGPRQRAIKKLSIEPFDELSDEFYAVNKGGRLGRFCADYVRSHGGEFFKEED